MSDHLSSKYEKRLSGGHPNSLGETIEVVEEVLNQPEKMEAFFNCYFSDDEVVRLRISNGLKRITKESKALVIPYLDRLLEEVSAINQPSAKWTLAQVFLMLEKEMTSQQQARAVDIMKENLGSEPDWIVQNQTMETLGKWSLKDSRLREWLIPQLQLRKSDLRKSVAKKAEQWLKKLGA